MSKKAKDKIIDALQDYSGSDFVVNDELIDFIEDIDTSDITEMNLLQALKESRQAMIDSGIFPEDSIQIKCMDRVIFKYQPVGKKQKLCAGDCVGNDKVAVEISQITYTHVHFKYLTGEFKGSRGKFTLITFIRLFNL